ncbi:stanniocalcin-like [Pholidichthys leucotaenia]
MLRCSALLLLLLALYAATGFEMLPEEAAPRRARFSANTPTDVARCLTGAVSAGCGFFSCLENSTCDTDGMHELCELFLHSAASFNTEGKTFVKKSLLCISQGISGKVFHTIRRCNIFQRMIAEVQEECYASHDICTVARTNPDAFGEVVQVPAHFPNRYYSTLLQTLQTCDEQTVEAVKAGIIARLGPDMETFLQVIQNKPCATDSNPAVYNNPASWRNMPVFNIQPGFRGRDPTHLFARKRRSMGDQEGDEEAEAHE